MIRRTDTAVNSLSSKEPTGQFDGSHGLEALLTPLSKIAHQWPERQRWARDCEYEVDEMSNRCANTWLRRNCEVESDRGVVGVEEDVGAWGRIKRTVGPRS